MNEDLSKTAFKCAQGPLEVADFAPQKHRGLRRHPEEACRSILSGIEVNTARVRPVSSSLG